MATKDYKALFVKQSTHKKFAIRAREKEMTFDELLQNLLSESK